MNFVVRDIFTHETTFIIPKEYLKVSKVENQRSQQAKFISWYDEESLRFIDITSEPKVEVIIKMNRSPDQKDKNNLSDFELLASCVPSFLDPTKYLTE